MLSRPAELSLLDPEFDSADDPANDPTDDPTDDKAAAA